eukprot:1183514-Prorocentrum_minimum.AAC.1
MQSRSAWTCDLPTWRNHHHSQECRHYRLLAWINTVSQTWRDVTSLASRFPARILKCVCRHVYAQGAGGAGPADRGAEGGVRGCAGGGRAGAPRSPRVAKSYARARHRQPPDSTVRGRPRRLKRARTAGGAAGGGARGSPPGGGEPEARGARAQAPRAPGGGPEPPGWDLDLHPVSSPSLNKPFSCRGARRREESAGDESRPLRTC